jgi:hypothetical protein
MKKLERKGGARKRRRREKREYVCERVGVETERQRHREIERKREESD